MNEPFFAALSAWLTQAGLAGTPETDIVPGFCERCVAAGLPLARAVVFIDTLHPVHEGRLFRWGYDPAQAPSVLEYGRTSPDGLAATGFDPKDVQAAARCRNSPFYQMLQTGDSLLRRRLSAATKDEFAWLSDLYAEGVTDYPAPVTACEQWRKRRRLVQHSTAEPEACRAAEAHAVRTDRAVASGRRRAWRVSSRCL